MNDEIKNKAVELTDEEIEKTAGGGEVTSTVVEKQCQHCGNIYSHTLAKCPSCGCPHYNPIKIYETPPHCGGGTGW